MIGLFNDITNIILGTLVAIAVIICLIIALKSEHLRKLCLYIMAIACIFFGIYSTAGLIKDVTAESYTNGSLEQKNTYGLDTFSYTSSSIVFTPNDSIYTWENNFLRVNNFNGVKNEYKIVFNDYLILDPDITTGSINFDITMEFLIPEGSQNFIGTMHTTIKFLSDKTYMKLSTNTQAEAQYFLDYFKNFGFKLCCYEVV